MIQKARFRPLHTFLKIERIFLVCVLFPAFLLSMSSAVHFHDVESIESDSLSSKKVIDSSFTEVYVNSGYEDIIYIKEGTKISGREYLTIGNIILSHKKTQHPFRSDNSEDFKKARAKKICSAERKNTTSVFWKSGVNSSWFTNYNSENFIAVLTHTSITHKDLFGIRILSLDNKKYINDKGKLISIAHCSQAQGVLISSISRPPPMPLSVG